MDKKSKTLLIILVIMTVASVGYTFYKTMIKQDFEVVNIEPLTDEDISEDTFEDASEAEME
ncbi:hypothetical protein A2995_00025 [Candidatus Nomurabacteria bacterium RIFCSPLOWO2_01_FULL_33_24]|uniref:Uncharacterized protein n=1 Tax=Candidatus Nomurabacteria bacterium RIFCSPLOWO2_01_FULL_33_24 TaxID=1801765 RepID=A0A1F6X325_9BACT|nr:MAG: hypothetical protein A2995_00025 [Candidatus Nomurabacteria bacterium RIFCSPLOWO2_01_FULL_33_24]